MGNIRHVLGISGGKDSAALAIYMKKLYPNLDIQYYTCDTGKELEETYALIQNLETYLGKKIELLRAAGNSHEDPFDHFLKMYGGFLPSSQSRWCTKKLKLEPFERYVGTDAVVSYVGIRGDENREGYISRKSNIQSIFPFRRNIWSEDVTTKLLNIANIERLMDIYLSTDLEQKSQRFEELLMSPIDSSFPLSQKLRLLLEYNTKDFNRLVFSFLKTTNYPLAEEIYFPLVENDEVLVREDIFNLLEESGVGIPAYYKEVDFEINGQKGQYARSRSGCYFCFFQQKIEWIWLYEQHPDRFRLAMEYEKDGYTWNDNERLEEMVLPDRMAQIKNEFIAKSGRPTKGSKFLIDILEEEEEIGCAACFI